MSVTVERSEDATKVNVWIDRKLWRSFRGLCLDQGVSPHIEAETAIREHLEKARESSSDRR